MGIDASGIANRSLPFGAQPGVTYPVTGLICDAISLISPRAPPVRVL